MSSEAPLPVNPRRMTWAQVPDAVVALIEQRAGAPVAVAAGSELGFSPGFAGVVEFADGSRLFLKVMSGDRDPWSIHLNRREAAILAELPTTVAAPRLRWALEIDDWFVMATDVVDGDHPVATDPAAAAKLWRAFEELASVKAPAELPAFHEHFEDLFTKWKSLADDPERAERMSALGDAGTWVLANLDHLMRWELEGIEASAGDALVHGDLRADNILLSADGIVIVDWPWATRGASWLDLAGYLPSHAMNGGGACWESFHAHPLSNGVSMRDERGIVAALAGFFAVTCTEPPHPGLPGLREFQRAQAIPALNWLRAIIE
jgi:aminoglycoside phosphotransferase (APT) family kinase protein